MGTAGIFASYPMNGEVFIALINTDTIHIILNKFLRPYFISCVLLYERTSDSDWFIEFARSRQANRLFLNQTNKAYDGWSISSYINSLTVIVEKYFNLFLQGENHKSLQAL